MHEIPQAVVDLLDDPEYREAIKAQIELRELPTDTIGGRLKYSRVKAGYTQAQMARRLDVTIKTIRNYEQNGSMKQPTLMAWALATAQPENWILTGSEGGSDLPTRRSAWNAEASPMDELYIDLRGDRPVTHSASARRLAA